MSKKYPKPPFPDKRLQKPGIEEELTLAPEYKAAGYKPSGKLEGRVALITGGDSGIGRAVALLYAREGADVAIVHLPEEKGDARKIQKEIESYDQRCICLPIDLSKPSGATKAVAKTIQSFGKLDVLVSNAAYQNRKKDILSITEKEWDHTFQVNMYAYFRLVKASLPYLKEGSSIIATSSVVSVEGSKSLVDYSATKGAINAFSRSLAQQLVPKGIRVNVVAPGPVWTPLNPADSGITPQHIASFGKDVPYGRPAQPEELAPAYVFLASNADSSYMTGTIIAEFGGVTIAA